MSDAQLGDNGLGVGAHLLLADGFVAGHAEYLKPDFPARLEIVHHGLRDAVRGIWRDHGEDDIHGAEHIRRPERQILGVAGAYAHTV